MTISPSELIRLEDVNLLYVSAENPDTIGIEVYFEGNMLFSVDMYQGGKLTIMFDDAENAEFDLPAFKDLISRCEDELKAWHANLTVPGCIWGQP